MSPDPTIHYPPELPITERRDELLAAIEANQVVVVAGETGSGKSTQLPKLCLELGRGTDALIGHTQPRRIAARTIAERVASELDTNLGDAVGYTVRFTDRVGPSTRVKVMTDGILLAEIPRDRKLSRYDTIIIDEAHERSLNIDFILGYLKQLLPRRDDLKVIITSATIDTDRFSRHFDDAPVIEVSGRTYPVEVRYHPLDGPDQLEPLDQTEGIAAAVTDLWRTTEGDVLVFCSGEREIRDATEAVAELKLPGAEVLPLYARLSAAEQQRVFQAHDRRRIVIATNVAETSVTVPGIRSVVDVGTARISRYSQRTKVQRLPVEKISQASADQRAGRCGRLGPGVCVRLYAEDDYDARPEFTEPEIRRTNLASVILAMASLRLGKVDAFPFVDPPEHRSIKDGIDLLVELDALDPEREGTRRWLTPLGRDLARLPVDPRFGRMLLEADEQSCLDEVMIIVAGLSVQDPRERPADSQQLADASHRRFADESSDFWSYLNLWDHLDAARRDRSRNQFRRMCRREYLNYHRIIEWQEIHSQLRQVARDLDLGPGSRSGSNRGRNRRRRGERPRNQRTAERVDTPARREAVHRSILAGLLSHIGTRPPDTDTSAGRGGRQGRDKRRRSEYLGARGARFAIAPGSSLAGSGPKWVMAGELVETSRLWARIVGPIDPGWVEDLAEHLATYSYGEPWWDIERGSALVQEKVMLYGLTLVANRAVQLGTVDRALARELFIHHALVEGEWQTEHAFAATNRELIASIEALEARSRRRDLLVESKAVFDFYDQRIPDHVISTAHFDSWWGDHRRRHPDHLTLTSDVLVNPEADHVDDDAFPDAWDPDGLDLELAYEFDPTSPLDGVSVLVPVDVLNQLEAGPFQWSVPGFRADLVSSLIRTLPKDKRRTLVPAADTVADVLPDLDPDRGPLLSQLASELGRRAGTVITVDDFDPARVPDHLRPTFRIINDDYELLAEGKDLAALQADLREEVRTTLTVLATTAGDQRWTRTGLRTWDVGTLPTVVESGSVKGYPSLIDEGDSVAVRLLPTEDEQHDAMWDGVRRLLRLNVAGPARQLDRLLDDETKLHLVRGHVQSKAEWYNDAIAAALDAVIAEFGGPPWSEAGFDQLLELARATLDDHLEAVATSLADLAAVVTTVHTKLDRLSSPTYALSIDDARAHLGRLAYPGFMAGVGLHRLDDVARYLEGIALRLDGLAKNPTRDLETLAICRRLDNDLATIAHAQGPSPELEEVTWMLEELRVSLFAQSLGVKGRISEKRARRALNDLHSAGR